MKFRPLILIPLFPLLSLHCGATSLTLTGSNGNLLVSGSGATAVTGNAFANGDTISYTGTPAAAFTVSVTGDIAPGSINLANTANTITFGGSNTVTGTSYTKSGTGSVYFNTGMNFSAGISTGAGFASTATANTGNCLASQTGSLASLELFSLSSDTYNLGGAITLTNTANANVLAFGGIGSGVNAAKTLSNDITLSSNAVQSRFVILGDSSTNTAQSGKHDVVLSGKISGGVSGATFYINTDQGSTGASSLKLTNSANDFTANIQVNRGGLAITSDAALGNSANTVTIDSNNTNGGMRFDAALTSARTFTFTSNEAVDTNGNDVTLSGIIAGAGTLTKKSAGTLTLGGTSANTFTSNLIISAGTVKLGKASSLGTTAGGTSISSGAVLDLNGQTIGAEAVTLNGTGISSGGALINSSATAASLSGAVTLGSNASIGGSGNTNLSGLVSGAFTLTKTGTGSLVLSNGSNSHSSTTIAGGPNSQTAAAIHVANNSALGSGAVTLTNTSAITALYNSAASQSIVNNIALSSSAGVTTRFLAKNATSFELRGVISGGSSTSTLLVDTDQGAGSTGVLLLNNSGNTFQGKVQINRGGLAVTSDGALGNSANSIFLDVGTATQVGLRFDAAMSSARALQLGSSKQVLDTNGNAVSLTGVVSGTGELHKAGSGTLTLSNSNTYSGLTNVTAGTLEVTGSLSNSTSVTVQSGAVLKVSGTIQNGVTVNNGGTLGGNGGQFNSSVTINGIHSPGASPGLQTFNNGLTYGSTATLNVELVGDTLGIRGTDYDGINVTAGTLSINPAATFNLITSAINYAAAAWDVNRSFTIIDLTGGSSSGGLFNLDTSNAGSFASEGSWSLAGTGGDVILNWTAVPEPGSILLGGIGLLTLLRRRR